MDKYLERLSNDLPPENKGYSFIKKLNIEIPILSFNVNIIKRKEIGVQLVEEMVLKLLDVGVSTIDDLHKILGVNKSIINITVANLSIKGYIAVTSGNCYLISKGNEILKNLKEITLETDKLSFLYINLITGEIYTQKLESFKEKISKPDNVLLSKIKVTKEYVENRIDDFKRIFEEIHNAYLGTEARDELYKVEDIEEVKIYYMNLTAYIYKNNYGGEIDISYKYDKLIREIQGEILEQIISENKFKDSFGNRPKYEMLTTEKKKELIDKSDMGLYEIINKYTKSNKDEKYELENDFYKLYKNDRILIENEISIFLEEITNRSKNICIVVNSIRDILFREDFLNPIINAIRKGSSVSIKYSHIDKNYKTILDKVKKSHPEVGKITFEVNKNKFYNMEFVIDQKYCILQELYNIKVLEDKYVTKEIYKFNNLSNSIK